MPELMIPVGPHLFTPDALKTASLTALRDLPEGHTSAIVGAVDSTGAQASIVFNSKDGHWQAVAAFHHDWTGDNRYGGSGRYSW